MLTEGYAMLLPNGKTLQVSLRGKGDTYAYATLNGKRLDDARITHDQLMKGGQLVFWRKEEQPVSASTTATTVPLTAITPAMPARPVTPIVESQISYTLNRQFRTWPLSMEWMGDQLLVRCNKAIYRIPQGVVEQADGFCWDSPQRDGATYIAEGTFAFISRKALDTLLKERKFIYDGITWREISRSEDTITVRADIDRTEMTISLTHPLPLVLSMRKNPLGIDWNIILHE